MGRWLETEGGERGESEDFVSDDVKTTTKATCASCPIDLENTAICEAERKEEGGPRLRGTADVSCPLYYVRTTHSRLRREMKRHRVDKLDHCFESRLQ